MSLFGALSNSNSALRVAEVGLSVIGDNIANANTPGYIRQELVQVSTSAMRVGGLLRSYGVTAEGIIQRVDKALLDRVNAAASNAEAASRIEQTYSDLEFILNDLGNRNLGTELNGFNNSLHELQNNPSSHALRQLVVLQGQQLADYMSEVHSKVTQLSVEANQEIINLAEEVNKLTKKIADLNFKIVDIEGGRTLGSDATGLREDRYKAVSDLSKLIDIHVQEQKDGNLNVFIAGDFLVSERNYREVTAAAMSANDLRREVRITETNARIDVRGGELAGLYEARDGILDAHLAQLDGFAADLAQAVNRVHVQGQGAEGFETLESTVAVEDDLAPLADAGLDFQPEDGTFVIELRDTDGVLVSRHQIDVNVAAGGTPSTFASIAADIDSIDGIEASIDPDGHLNIETTSANSRFNFASDNSGFLAAAGLNTFFRGTSALTLKVEPRLLDDPKMLAVSRGGPDHDTENLEELIDLVNRPLETLGGQSLIEIQHAYTTRLAQDVSLQRAVTEGLESFHNALMSDHLGVSGVNINEESIKLISTQRAFQASARVISVASDLLELLTSI